MSQCWSDLTGKLLYLGEPVVTSVIKGLFGALSLSAGSEPLTEIQMVTEDVCPSWDTVMGKLVTELGLEDEFEDQDEVQEGLVAEVRKRFGDKPADRMDEMLAAGLAAGTDADVQELCELALLMRDGHNLRGVSAQGGWGGDRIEVGCFGGWSQYESENVSMAMNTQRLCDIAEMVDASLGKAATAEAMGEALKSLEGIAGGFVKDSLRRAQFRKQLGAWLMKKADEDEAMVETDVVGEG